MTADRGSPAATAVEPTTVTRSQTACRACGESDARCMKRGMWSACCAACDERDRRTHPNTLPDATGGSS